MAGLILARNFGQEVIIRCGGDSEIRIKLVDPRRPGEKEIRLQIDAPQEMQILRGEHLGQVQESPAPSLESQRPKVNQDWRKERRSR